MLRRAVIVWLTIAGAGHAAAMPGSAWLTTFGATSAPIGHELFCRAAPGECRGGGLTPVRHDATEAAQMAELRRVNSEVNRAIQPATDIELYGLIEYWTYPKARGDCEDYVLLKRRRLIDLGWPAARLLITVVRDENSEGHAVLVARTARGDLVLDNKTSDIREWRHTPYIYIKQQSAGDPRLWLSLMPMPVAAPIAAAGRRR